MSKVTLAQWKKNKRHLVTLPSGTQVEIEIPNLPQMLKVGQIPNNLVDVAVQVASGQQRKVTKELLVEQADFYHKLAAMTIKEPAVSEEDIPELPYEDIEMVVEMATRNRDLDAVGHHLAGLEKSDEFRTFRGLGSGDENLEGV